MLACEQPNLLLGMVLNRGTVRKARLFGVACCRRVWDLVTDPRSRAGVEKAELYAEGMRTRHVLQHACDRAHEATFDVEGETAVSAACAVRSVTQANSWACSSGTSYSVAHAVALRDSPTNIVGGLLTEYRVHCQLIRCIFPSPFRELPTLPALPPNVVQMAEAVYKAGDFAALPVLADALEEAGGTDADALAHLRGDGPHARGCWAVDWVLGKQ